MKSKRPYARVTVTPKGERALKGGHPWVYEGEVLAVEPVEGTVEPGLGAAEQERAQDEPALEHATADGKVAQGTAPGTELALGTPENGSLVDVVSKKGHYLGTGLISQKSKIRVRIVSRNANDSFDAAFWERRCRWAWDYRKQVMGADATCCRLVFSEADGFPGLIVDRFSDVLVAQVLCVGMERARHVIFPVLCRVLSEDGVGIRGVYERNDVSTRRLEGLGECRGWYRGDGVPQPQDPTATKVQITENGVRYEVDFENGQKTGFFLDQKYNRRAVGRLARGRRVLDCFTHTGSFGLNAALGGAAHVNAVDISELAIDQARANARLNGVKDRMEFTCENVFDLLTRLEEERCRDYDFIVLDPPAFTKSRKTVKSAERGYKDINYRAMKILPRGGYLATCSCSHFMDTARFRHMLESAARDAGVQLRQIEQRQQAPDHPILLGVPETDYLKFFLFQVV